MGLEIGIGDALGTDYFHLKEQATPQQLDYLARTREFVQTEVQPNINDYWERAEFPWPLIEKLAMVDLEAIHTFEGTETIQTLIVGRDITGIGAFA